MPTELEESQAKEIERLKAVVNLCIDDPQNWTQRAIDLGLMAGEDAEWYNQSMLAENTRLKAEIERLTSLVNSWAPIMKCHEFL